MPRRIPAWETEQESFAARCPRPDYARIVLEVCLCADRLADSMGRHSWHGERREALLALRKLENTRPPDLCDAERATLATLSVALGSTDPEKLSTDDITYTPRRDYGLMYNIGPEFQQQARDAASAARALWQPVAHAGAKEKAPAEKAKPSPVSAPAG